MKRRMIWIFLAGALAGLVLSGLYKHFVTDQIMDGATAWRIPMFTAIVRRIRRKPFSKRRAA